MKEVKPFRSDCTKAELERLVEVGSTYEGRGAVCDLGCGIGGSTAALASGMAGAGYAADLQIHAYDLFDEYRNAHSTLDAFARNTRDYRDYIQVHKGDIATADAPDSSIEVLFVDIAKTRTSHVATVQKFFPRLDDRWTLLNQDFGRPHLVWICLSFSLLMRKYSWEIVDDMIIVSGRGPIAHEDMREMTARDPELSGALSKIHYLKSVTQGMMARGRIPYHLILNLTELFVLVDYGDLASARALYASVVSELGTPPRHLRGVLKQAASLTEN